MSSLAAPSAVVRPVGPRDEPLVRVAPLEIGPLVVDPPVLQAPMAGFTNYAYRQIVREFGGAGLQATEMVHAKGFLWLEERRGRAARSAVGRGRRAAAAGRADLGQRSRRRWPRSGPSWPTSSASAWSTSTSAAP